MHEQLPLVLEGRQGSLRPTKNNSVPSTLLQIWDFTTAWLLVNDSCY